MNPADPSRHWLAQLRLALLRTGMACLLLLISGCTEISAAASGNQFLWVVISLLLVMQTLLIIGLQRSRLHNKRARQALKESQKELKQRITERTTTLELTNLKLQDEIIRHEATVLLLRETQDYLHNLLDAMPSVIIGVTHDGLITHWNTAAEVSTGIAAKDALGQPLTTHYPCSYISQKLIEETIAAGVPYRKENMREGQAGDARYMDLTIYPLIAAQGIGAVIRLDDVTTKVKMEHMMIQNEKMFSLGELAAGIAHEINNPIGAILHSVQNILRRTSPTFERNRLVTESMGIDIQQIHAYLEKRGIYKFLENIREGGQRSAQIVTNMLEFSHSRLRAIGPLNLQSVLDHSIELSTNIGKGKEKLPQPITVIRDYDAHLPRVMGSAPELQQVILNLLRNARQAFVDEVREKAPAPTIIVRAKSDQERVIIEVEDNGPGMSDEVKQHIFEPFYTTKEVGKGTGLGLSVSYFIISEHHNGKLAVESAPGKGTKFIISLPLAESLTDAPKPTPSE
jgi:two-component system NtrC family sensor kinase